MSAAAAAKRSSQAIILETPNFYMRRIDVSDASDRVGAWFEQPEVCEGLNSAPGKKTKAELEAWIASFDQHTNRINAMFDKRNDLMITIGNSQFNWDISRVMMNIVVGEPAYRHCGAVFEGLVPVRDYVFEELKMKVMTATVLATNKPVIAILESTGSVRNQTLKNYKTSLQTGNPVDLHLYSQTAESWRDWKSKNAELINAIKDCSARLPSVSIA